MSCAAWCVIPEVAVAVGVLDIAQAVIPWVVAMVFVVIVGCDVAAALGGSECVRRGWIAG